MDELNTGAVAANEGAAETAPVEVAPTEGASQEELENTAGQSESEASADDWDDVDLSDLEDNDKDSDFAAPEDARAEPPKAEEPQQQETKEAPAEQTFTLEHRGQTRQVKQADLMALARQGLEFGNLRGEFVKARGEIERLTQMEAFLKELAAPQNLTIPELMDNTRAQILAEKDGIDRTVALERVKLERERREFQTQKERATQARQAAQQRTLGRQNQFLRFAQNYPNVEPKSIPKEVWQAFGKGTELSQAYGQWENSQLRQQVESLKKQAQTAEQNAKNRVRSTGSQKTAGSGNQMDAFDALWYDGT